MSEQIDIATDCSGIEYPVQAFSVAGNSMTIRVMEKILRRIYE